MANPRNLFLELLIWTTIMSTTVVALQPLPKESSDWCAKANTTTKMPATPPEPISVPSAPLPNYNCKPLSKEECDKLHKLKIPQCTSSSVIDLNLNEKDRTNDYTRFRDISLGIANIPPDRAVSFSVRDEHLTISKMAVAINYTTLPEDMFITRAIQPIRLNVIEFTLFHCGPRCTKKLPVLNLTNLLSFTISKRGYTLSHKKLSLHRKDFAHNPRLHAVVITQCSMLEIEMYTFTNLPELRLLALENDFVDDSFSKPEERAVQLRRIHCECEYKWLRDFLRVNPELITGKPKGGVYQVCQAVSREYLKINIFVPVDCLKNFTHSVGEEKDKFDWTQVAFAVSAGHTLFVTSLGYLWITWLVIAC